MLQYLMKRMRCCNWMYFFLILLPCVLFTYLYFRYEVNISAVLGWCAISKHDIPSNWCILDMTCYFLSWQWMVQPSWLQSRTYFVEKWFFSSVPYFVAFQNLSSSWCTQQAIFTFGGNTRGWWLDLFMDCVLLGNCILQKKLNQTHLWI